MIDVTPRQQGYALPPRGRRENDEEMQWATHTMEDDHYDYEKQLYLGLTIIGLFAVFFMIVTSCVDNDIVNADKKSTFDQNLRSIPPTACEKGKQGCVKCEVVRGHSQCAQCEHGYANYGRTCHQCPANCFSCDKMGCYLCHAGFFKKIDKTCTACYDGCQQCTGAKREDCTLWRHAWLNDMKSLEAPKELYDLNNRAEENSRSLE